jgi:hypothetical protein
MKITLDSTARIVHVSGTPARVWEGHTASGIPVYAFVSRLATDDARGEELAAELRKTNEPVIVGDWRRP